MCRCILGWRDMGHCHCRNVIGSTELEIVSELMPQASRRKTASQQFLPCTDFESSHSYTVVLEHPMTSPGVNFGGQRERMNIPLSEVAAAYSSLRHYATQPTLILQATRPSFSGRCGVKSAPQLVGVITTTRRASKKWLARMRLWNDVMSVVTRTSEVGSFAMLVQTPYCAVSGMVSSTDFEARLRARVDRRLRRRRNTFEDRYFPSG
jgi:hypothetical protein